MKSRDDWIRTSDHTHPMRVRYQTAPHPELDRVYVGVAGFEPATSCSQSRRDDRATLHPEKDEGKYKLSQKQKQSNLYNILLLKSLIY